MAENQLYNTENMKNEKLSKNTGKNDKKKVEVSEESCKNTK